MLKDEIKGILVQFMAPPNFHHQNCLLYQPDNDTQLKCFEKYRKYKKVELNRKKQDKN